MKTAPLILVSPNGQLRIRRADGALFMFKKREIDDLACATRKCVALVNDRATAKKRIAMGCCPEHALPLIPFPGFFTRFEGPFAGRAVLALKCPLSNCGNGAFALSSSGPFERMPIPRSVIPTVENLLRNGLIRNPDVLPAKNN